MQKEIRLAEYRIRSHLQLLRKLSNVLIWRRQQRVLTNCWRLIENLVSPLFMMREYLMISLKRMPLKMSKNMKRKELLLSELQDHQDLRQMLIKTFVSSTCKSSMSFMIRINSDSQHLRFSRMDVLKEETAAIINRGSTMGRCEHHSLKGRNSIPSF